MTYYDICQIKVDYLNSRIAAESAKRYHLDYNNGAVTLIMRNGITGERIQISPGMSINAMHELLTTLTVYESNKG